VKIFADSYCNVKTRANREILSSNTDTRVTRFCRGEY